MISTIITGATIVDGTGTSRFLTDIAFSGDCIARIGSCDGLECIERIDGTGSVVAPGFIDACSHTNTTWVALPSWTSSLAQGITTEITGTCGEGSYDPGLRSRETDVTRRSFATPSQCVRTACEAGALGVSLDFSTVPVPEALAVARQARAGGAARLAAHLRDYGRELLPALDEAIDVAARAGVHLHLSHLQARRGAPDGAMERALERIDDVRERGTPVTCDVYPYTAAWITLISLLPQSVTAESLDDDAVANAAALAMEARHGDLWHDLMLAEVSSEERMAWCGMRFDEIARQMRMRPARAVIEFIRHDRERALAFAFVLREEDVATALSARFCSIGTSAAALGFHDESFGLVHPRTFGTMPRTIGRFVRQRRTLDLEEAIYRMTSLPARTVGLDGFGELHEGARADAVLFDEHTFVDTATYARPVSAPLGLKHVWTAGHRKGAL